MPSVHLVRLFSVVAKTPGNFLSMAEVSSPHYFVTGGTLSAQAESYIERAADAALLSALLDSQFCYVLNSRQMGKSSICVRTMARLTEAGVKTAFIDLTRIGGRNVSAEQWYAGILGELGRSLGLRSQLLTYWKDHPEMGPMLRLFSALREVVLQLIDARVAIFFDEIDATRTLSFDTDEFFAGIRECYNRRAQDPSYNRLTFCLLGVAIPADLIANPVSTPFNIGQRILLRDFSRDEARAFSEGIREADSEANRPPRNGVALVERVHYWTNGHPFLTQTLCQTVAQNPDLRTPKDVDALVKRELLEPKARDSNINLADVANRALNAGASDPEPEKLKADILSLYLRILTRRRVADDESNRAAALLKLSGLVKPKGNRLVIRNRIYRTVFGAAWIRENMPQQEIRRQRRAFLLGALRVAAACSITIFTLSYFAYRNHLLAQEASHARRIAEYESYVSEVNLMRTASQDHDNRRLGSLLQITRNSPFHGLECSLWNATLHDADYEVPFPHNYPQVAISRDGKEAAVVDTVEKTVHILSLPDLRQIGSPAKITAQDTVFHMQNGWFVGRLQDYKTWTVHELGSMREISRVSVRGATLTSLTISADETKFAAIAIADGDRLVRDFFEFSLPDSRQLVHWRLPGSELGYPNLDRSGNRVSFLEFDSTEAGKRSRKQRIRSVTVREAATGKLLDSFTPPSFPTMNTLSPDGKYVACSITDARLFVRDIDGHWIIFQQPTEAPANSLQFSDNNSKLLAVNDNLSANLWDIKTGSLLEDRGGAFAAALDPNGNFMSVFGAGSRSYLARSKDKNVTAFPVGNGVLKGPRPDGKMVLVGAESIWLMDSHSLAISPQSIPLNESVGVRRATDEYFMTNDAAGGSEVHSISDGLLFKTPYPSVYDFSVAPNGQTFAYTSIERCRVHIVDRNGHEIKAVDFDSTQTTGLAWSPNGNFLAVGLIGDIALLDPSGNLIQTIKGAGPTPTSLVFDHRGKNLAIGYVDGSTYLCAVDGHRPPRPFFGHVNQVNSLSFSPKDRRLVSTDNDGTIRLWDTETGRELVRLSEGSVHVISAVILPDESALLASFANGEIRRYPLLPLAESPPLEPDGSRFNGAESGPFGPPRGPGLDGGGRDFPRPPEPEHSMDHFHGP